MKRIEAVIKPHALDGFKEAASQLGIAKFDVIEVHRSGGATNERRRVYRGSEHSAGLLPRLRIEFVLFDDDVQATLYNLLELVPTESITIFGLDRTILAASEHLEATPVCRSADSRCREQLKMSAS
jgi:nitrogen regulatory protein PII